MNTTNQSEEGRKPVSEPPTKQPQAVFQPVGRYCLVAPLPPEEWERLSLTAMEGRAGVGFGYVIHSPLQADLGTAALVAYALRSVSYAQVAKAAFVFVPLEDVLAQVRVV